MFGSFPLGRVSLAYLGYLCFDWPLPVRFSCCFLLLVLRGSSLSLLLFGLSWCGCCLVVACPCGLGACGWARSLQVPPLPLPPWLSSGVFWSSQLSAGPFSGYLVVSATVRLPYLWHGVSWLIGSCLHSASWQQRLRPCVFFPRVWPMSHCGSVLT